MAYLSTRRSALLSSGSGPAQSAPEAPAAQPTQDVAPSSGAFTDLRAYLSANGDQARSLADRLIGDPATRGQANPGSLTAQAASAAAPAMLGLKAPWTVQAGSQAETDANAKIQARNSGAQNMLGTINSYAAPGGLETMLGDTYGKSGAYTPGMASLDAYLLGGVGAGQRMADLKSKWGPLLGDQAPFAGKTTPPASTWRVPGAAKPAGTSGLAPAPPATYQDRGEWTQDPTTGEWKRRGGASDAFQPSSGGPWL